MRALLSILALLLAGCAKESDVEDVKPVSAEMLEANVLHVVLRPNKKIESNGQMFESDEITRLIKESKEEVDSVFLVVEQDAKAVEVVRIIDLIKAEGIERIYVSTLKK